MDVSEIRDSYYLMLLKIGAMYSSIGLVNNAEKKYIKIIKDGASKQIEDIAKLNLSSIKYSRGEITDILILLNNMEKRLYTKNSLFHYYNIMSDIYLFYYKDPMTSERYIHKLNRITETPLGILKLCYCELLKNDTNNAKKYYDIYCTLIKDSPLIFISEENKKKSSFRTKMVMPKQIEYYKYYILYKYFIKLNDKKRATFYYSKYPKKFPFIK